MSSSHYSLRKRKRPYKSEDIEDSDSDAGEAISSESDVDFAEHQTATLPPPSQPWPVAGDVPIAVRFIIINYYNSLVSNAEKRGAIAEIARNLGMKYQTIHRIISNYADHGTLESLPRMNVGRPIELGYLSGQCLKDKCYQYLERQAATGLAVTAASMHREFLNSGIIDQSFKYDHFLDTLARFGLKNTGDRRSREVRVGIKDRTRNWCIRFHREIVQNREKLESEQLIECWQDESYVHHHHQRRDALGNPHESRTLRPARKYKGARYCFSAFITRHGVVPGSIWMFSPQDSGRDYHKNFNGTNFKEYFGRVMMEHFERQFPNRRGLFIMDNARYHKTYSNVPTPSSTRAEMLTFLTQKNRTVDPMAKRKELYEQILKLRDEEGCDLEKIAMERGHKVLFLPPSYSRWNPIELFWAAVKQKVANTYSADRTMTQLKSQLEAALHEYGTEEHISRMVQHCWEEIRTTISLFAQETESEQNFPVASELDYFSEDSDDKGEE